MGESASPGVIVILCVSFLLAALLIPIGMTQLLSADMGSWDASVKTIYTVLLPILVVISMALYFIPSGKGKSE